MGGQAIGAIEYYLAPFVRMTFEQELIKSAEILDVEINPKEVAITSKDYETKSLKGLTNIDRAIQSAINKTVRRTYQAMEGLIHNLNGISSRGGNQTVFSSINFGTDTSPEGRLVMWSLLQSTMKGVGDGETAIFPISIFKVKKGINFNPEDPNYDIYKYANKVTARRFFPNYLNLDATFNQNEEWNIDDPKRYEKEVSCMGCRTRVFENRHGEKMTTGRGNLSFTSVNLPRLGIEAKLQADKKDKDKILEYFYKDLDDKLELIAKQLYDRYLFQCKAYKFQFPLLMQGMWKNSEKLDTNDKVEDVLKHGTLGVSFIGLAETLIAMFGKHHGESEEMQRLGLEIVEHMQNKCKEFSDKYDLNYSLLASPAEGLSGKFTKKDKKKYGIIKGVTDKDYYTNSSHIPVYYKCTVNHKSKIESPYHALTTAGHIFYAELDGNIEQNIDVVDKVVRAGVENNAGYISINHNRTICLDCSYETTKKNITSCPKCSSTNLDILQRITGYLVGGKKRWNSGKSAELKDRVTHSQ